MSHAQPRGSYKPKPKNTGHGYLEFLSEDSHEEAISDNEAEDVPSVLPNTEIRHSASEPYSTSEDPIGSKTTEERHTEEDSRVDTVATSISSVLINRERTSTLGGLNRTGLSGADAVGILKGWSEKDSLSTSYTIDAVFVHNSFYRHSRYPFGEDYDFKWLEHVRNRFQSSRILTYEYSADVDGENWPGDFEFQKKIGLDLCIQLHHARSHMWRFGERKPTPVFFIAGDQSYGVVEKALLISLANRSLPIGDVHRSTGATVRLAPDGGVEFYRSFVYFNSSSSAKQFNCDYDFSRSRDWEPEFRNEHTYMFLKFLANYAKCLEELPYDDPLSLKLITTLDGGTEHLNKHGGDTMSHILDVVGTKIQATLSSFPDYNTKASRTITIEAMMIHDELNMIGTILSELSASARVQSRISRPYYRDDPRFLDKVKMLAIILRGFTTALKHIRDYLDNDIASIPSGLITGERGSEQHSEYPSLKSLLKEVLEVKLALQVKTIVSLRLEEHNNCFFELIRQKTCLALSNTISRVSGLRTSHDPSPDVYELACENFIRSSHAELFGLVGEQWRSAVRGTSADLDGVLDSASAFRSEFERGIRFNDDKFMPAGRRDEEQIRSNRKLLFNNLKASLSDVKETGGDLASYFESGILQGGQSLDEIDRSITEVESNRPPTNISSKERPPTPPEETELHYFASVGAVSNGPPTNIRSKERPPNPSEETWLHYFASVGAVSTARLLLYKGAPIDSLDRDGRTPLHRAIAGGSRSMIRLLLSKGAAVETVDRDGFTPLHLAAGYCGAEVIRTLIEHKTGVNMATSNGMTPLHIAAHRCDRDAVDVVRALLEHGADPLVTTRELHNTLFISAAHGGNSAMLAVLIQVVPLKAIKEVDAHGENLLHVISRIRMHAWKNQHYSEAALSTRLLLDAGVSFDQLNEEGVSPFHLAVIYSRINVIGEFVSMQKKISKTKVQLDPSGRNPLQLAAFYLRQTIAKFLIEEGESLFWETRDDILELLDHADAGRSYLKELDRKGAFDLRKFDVYDASDIDQRYDDLTRFLRTLDPSERKTPAPHRQQQTKVPLESLHPHTSDRIGQSSTTSLRSSSEDKDISNPDTPENLAQVSQTPRAEATGANNFREYECPEAFISRIIDTSGLPKVYRRRMSRPALSSVKSISIQRVYSRHASRVDVEYQCADWIEVPSTIMNQLRVVSYKHLLQKGTLVRDGTHTALISIADAAVRMLNGLHAFLECILFLVDHDLRSDVHQQFTTDFSPEGPAGHLTVLELVMAPHLGEQPHPYQAKIGLISMGKENKLTWRIGELESLHTNTKTQAKPPLDVHRLVKSQLSWLDMVLGGVSEPKNPFSFLSPLRDEAQQEEYAGCWRSKITDGNIIVPHLPVPSMESLALDPEQDELPAITLVDDPLSKVPDGLVLTAGSLWDLYDNSLRRIPDCSCTFITPARELLQCKLQVNGWLIWHILPEDSPRCLKGECPVNIILVTDTTNKHSALKTNDPCILGWEADYRRKPKEKFWETVRDLKLGEKFLKNRITKYKPGPVQIQTQLAVPTGHVTPSISLSTAISRTLFKIKNSLDPKTLLNRRRAIKEIMLIYCEKRGIHLAVEGAEVLDLICERLSLKFHFAPPGFSDNSTACERIKEYLNFHPPDSDGLGQIPGQDVVGIAVEMVTGMLNKSKEIGFKKGATYWSLEDLIQNENTYALRPPKTFLHDTWKPLFLKSHVLVLAVGKIQQKFLTIHHRYTEITWIPDPISNRGHLATTQGIKKPTFQMSTFQNAFSRRDRVRHPCALGGIFISGNDLLTWLKKAEISFDRVPIPGSIDIKFGEDEDQSQKTFQLAKATSEVLSTTTIDCLCTACVRDDSLVDGLRCLHYLE